ncbi:unnamed protein product [Lupinus luteus]|uniref:Protein DETOXIFICATION n=1 Tax=Lupinus luteus TaxID=3873 RepID=A0AAV1XAV6_LUPLU
MGKEETVALLTTKNEEENENNENNGVAPLDSAFLIQLKKVGSMAAPMVAVTVSQYLLQVVSLMMVGHLGALVSFSGVAIASSFAEVTGFSVLRRNKCISFAKRYCGSSYLVVSTVTRIWKKEHVI